MGFRVRSLGVKFQVNLRCHTWLHMNQLKDLPLNPKLNSCFSDEDFVRRLCNVETVMH